MLASAVAGAHMSEPHGPALWPYIGPHAGVPTDAAPVAVLHQRVDPPVLGGAVKPANPHGYRDSAADIAAALVTAGWPVCTPGQVTAGQVTSGQESGPEDAWSYPDTPAGIAAALEAGAGILWCNTTVFRAHPVAQLPPGLDPLLVSQPFGATEDYEDKSRCHELLRRHGVPVPTQLSVTAGSAGPADLEGTLADALAGAGLTYPCVVKPCRGRGSEGVTVAPDEPTALAAIRALTSAVTRLPGGGTAPRYGEVVLVEEYLPGTEWTVTVLPPGRYDRLGAVGTHWALPPVRRTGHDRGVLPYSGHVPVERNSVAVPGRPEGAVATMVAAAEQVAGAIGATAPVRVDCRAGADGRYRAFDTNLKPNMTGPGRPGRDGARNLCGLAAEAAGWRFEDLVLAMVGGARPWHEQVDSVAAVPVAR